MLSLIISKQKNIYSKKLIAKKKKETFPHNILRVPKEFYSLNPITS